MFLKGKTIVETRHGCPHDLMPKINHYNAYTLVIEDKEGRHELVVWNSHGETNLSAVIDMT